MQPNNNCLYACASRPSYMSVDYHRAAGRANNKGLWIISRDEEATRFYCAIDHNNSSPEYPGMWHLETDDTYVGRDRELIAFFPAPENPTDPWHGYPFTFERAAPKARIQALKQVAKRLEAAGSLSLARATKIRRGEL